MFFLFATLVAPHTSVSYNTYGAKSGHGGRRQRAHRGRDRQAHGLAARGDDGDEGRARGKGQCICRIIAPARPTAARRLGFDSRV